MWLKLRYDWDSASLERRLAEGLLWTLTGTAVARGAVFAASIVLARLLGRTTFGQFGAIESTVGMFAVFGNMGLAVASTKFLARYRQTDPLRAGRILALCCCFALAAGAAATLCLVGAAAWLATHSLDAPQLTVDVRIAGCLLLFSAINGTMTGALHGLHAFRDAARNNLVLGIASVPLLIGGATAAGLRGAVLGLVATQTVNCVLQATTLRRVAARQGIPLEWTACWRERGLLFRVSLPALISASLNAPVNWLAVMMLINYGGGYSQLGLLQVANNWFLLLLFLPGQLGLVYFPMFESLLAENRSSDVLRLMGKLVAANFVMFGTFAAAITLWADGILRCYGPQYANAHGALVVTAWTAVLVAVQQPLCTLAIASSRMWHVTNCSLLWAAVNLTLTYQLLDWGALGITVARLAAYAVYAGLIGMLILRPVLYSSPRLPAAATTALYRNAA